MHPVLAFYLAFLGGFAGTSDTDTDNDDRGKPQYATQRDKQQSKSNTEMFSIRHLMKAFIESPDLLSEVDSESTAASPSEKIGETPAKHELRVDRRRRAQRIAARLSPKEYQCNLCGRVCIRLNSLVNHINRTHRHNTSRVTSKSVEHSDTQANNARPRKCRLCSQSYYTPSGLYKHTRKDHGGSKKAFPKGLACGMCDKSYSHLSTLHAHRVAKHSGAKVSISDNIDLPAESST